MVKIFIQQTNPVSHPTYTEDENYCPGFSFYIKKIENRIRRYISDKVTKMRIQPKISTCTLQKT